MSCANEAVSPVLAMRHQQTDGLAQHPFIRAIVTSIHILQEALAMRRAAHKRYRLDTE
jgi:hypothetical protein